MKTLKILLISMVALSSCATLYQSLTIQAFHEKPADQNSFDIQSIL